MDERDKPDRTQQSMGNPPSSSDAHATVVATCKVIYQVIDIFYHGSEATAIGGWIALNGRLGNG